MRILDIRSNYGNWNTGNGSMCSAFIRLIGENTENRPRARCWKSVSRYIDYLLESRLIIRAVDLAVQRDGGIRCPKARYLDPAGGFARRYGTACRSVVHFCIVTNGYFAGRCAAAFYLEFLRISVIAARILRIRAGDPEFHAVRRPVSGLDDAAVMHAGGPGLDPQVAAGGCILMICGRIREYDGLGRSGIPCYRLRCRRNISGYIGGIDRIRCSDIVRR